MNKKAMSLGYGTVIAGIIGIVIIALVVGGPLRGVYNVVGEKIFGVLSPDAEKEFVPYTHPTKATIALNSANAFACAARIIYFHELNYSKHCADGTIVKATPTGAVISNIIGMVAAKPCTGVKYGDTCVECGFEKHKSTNKKGMVCDVKHFQLPEDAPYVLKQGAIVSAMGKGISVISPDAAKSLLGYHANNPTAEWLIGIGDPEYLFYYERFPEGEADWWHVDAFSFNTWFVITSAGFNAVFGAGGASAVKAASKKAIATAAAKTVAKKLGRAHFKQSIKQGLKASAKTVIERNLLFRLGAGFTTRIKNLFLADTAEKLTKKGLIGFTLTSAPEKVLSEAAVERIANQLLRAGQITKKGAVTASQKELKEIIKKEALKSLRVSITESDDLIRKAGRELIKLPSTAPSKLPWEQTIKVNEGFWDTFSKILGDPNTHPEIRKSIKAGGFVQALQKHDLRLYRELTKKGLTGKKKFKDAFINQLGTRAQKSIDDFEKNVRLLKKADDFADKYSKEIIDKYAGEVTQEVIEAEVKKMALRGYMSNFYAPDGTFKSKEFIENIAIGDGKKMLDAIEKLPIEYQQQVLTNAIKTANHMSEKEFMAMINMMGSAVDDVAKQGKLASLNSAFVKQLDKVDNFIGILPGGKKAVSAKNWAVWAAKVPPKTTYHTAKFIRDHRILVFIMAHILSDWQESINEKMIDRGSYNLELLTPTMHYESDHPIKLPDGFSYISLIRDGIQTPTRFHLVSPCITDLKMYGADEKCTLNEDIYKYNIIPFEDSGKFPASRSMINTPVKSDSVIFAEPSKDDVRSRVDYYKMRDIIDKRSNLRYDTWYSIAEIGIGSVDRYPDWYYKLTSGGGLYIMTGDGVFIYRHNPFYDALFSEKWYDQYDYIAETAKQFGVNKWHDGKDVGGFIDWEYLVSGYGVSYGSPFIVMFARNSNTGAYQHGLGKDLGSKYVAESIGTPDLTQKEKDAIKTLPSVLRQDNPSEDPPAVLNKYIRRIEQQDYPFFENAYFKPIYTLPHKMSMGGGRSYDWYLKNINISRKNYEKRTEDLQKIFDLAQPHFMKCLDTGVECIKAATIYRQIIRLIVMDEHLPANQAFYQVDLGHQKPIILQDQIDMLSKSQNALADIYAISGGKDFQDILKGIGETRAECLAAITNGTVTKTIDSEGYACEAYLSYFMLALDMMQINKQGDPKASLIENNQNLQFIYDDWYVFHRLSGVLKDRAIEIMAIFDYFDAPAELQVSLYALDKNIIEANEFKEDCTLNKNYSACRTALDRYQSILVDRGAGYFELSDVPLEDVEERMAIAEMYMLDIFRSASNSKELFKITGIKESRCDSAASSEKFWCIVNALKEETPYFTSLRATITRDAEAGMALLTGIAGASPLFGDRDYDTVRGNVRINLFMQGKEIKNPRYQNFWRQEEIASYVYYKNMDCYQAATLMATIPVFAKLYGLDQFGTKKANDYARRCSTGFNAIYPTYLEKKMIPFFSTRRPAVMYYDAFDEYCIPEMRRIEKDKKPSDDTYFQLIEKNNYYQTKAKILDAVDQQQAYFNKVGDVSRQDYNLWLDIQKVMNRNFPENIVVNGVKFCDKPDNSGTLGAGAKKHITVPTIKVIPQFSEYKTMTNQANYCYSLPLGWYDRNAEYVVMAGGIFLDAFVEGFTFALTGNIILARAAVVVSGAAQAVYLEELRLERVWPGQNQHYNFAITPDKMEYTP